MVKLIQKILDTKYKIPDTNFMPAQPQQELNIDDLRSQQRGNDESSMQDELNKKRMRAKQTKKPKTPSSVLGNLPARAASNENPQDEKDENQEQPDQQNQQPGSKEEKVKKLWPWQVGKKKELMKEYRELEKELDKLYKLTCKYKSTNFFFLALLACFIEMADLLFTCFWVTVVLAPIAICIGMLKGSASLFIYIKIYNIKNEQKTKDAWWWSLIAFIVGLIPGVNVLPEGVLRVRQARNSAKAQFEKHKDEIKKIQKKMDKLGRQLWGDQ
ncbi:MAG: hypothetical protein V1688_03925 [bacterium]